MTSILAEDILEEILNTGKEEVQLHALSLSHHAEAEIEKTLGSLVEHGFVHLNNEAIRLTKKGTEKATQVARKHAVLANFLTEVLGRQPEAASEEACILEHNISTETIDRLDNFLDRKNLDATTQETPPEYANHNNLTCKNPIVPLSECPEGSLLHVSMICRFAKHSRLVDLGVVPGELITLRRKLANNAVVITVKSCDIALSPEVSENIMVERCETL
ncbi:MAG: metal-dependent transcriptional regulator [Methanocalculaceae archaeon]|jgi:DtxR family Mn-dependent transcriptional regulator|nr:metal-dependent transcriptional regulator [Methanocalculaceae archaeon]